MYIYIIYIINIIYIHIYIYIYIYYLYTRRERERERERERPPAWSHRVRVGGHTVHRRRSPAALPSCQTSLLILVPQLIHI